MDYLVYSKHFAVLDVDTSLGVPNKQRPGQLEVHFELALIIVEKGNPLSHLSFSLGGARGGVQKHPNLREPDRARAAGREWSTVHYGFTNRRDERVYFRATSCGRRSSTHAAPIQGF